MRSALQHILAELRGRPIFGLTLAGVVALITLLAASITVLLAERERAVTGVMDRADLPLAVVPAGVSATQHQRFELSTIISANELEALRRTLKKDARIFEPWLIATLEEGGKRVPLVGLDPEAQRRLLGERITPREVVPGALAIQVLATRSELSFSWRGVHWVWDRSLPEMGTPEDRAVFLRRRDLANALGTDGVSKVLLSPAPGVTVAELASRIKRAHPTLDSLASPVRGLAAERETIALLGRARRLVLIVTIGLLLLAAIAWASQEIRRTRRESTILTAVGASPQWLWSVLVGRIGALGLAGGLAGTGLIVGWLWLCGSAILLPWLAADLLVITATACLVPPFAAGLVAGIQAARGRTLIHELQPVR